MPGLGFLLASLSWLWGEHQLFAIAVLLATAGIAWSNLRALRALGEYPPTDGAADPPWRVDEAPGAAVAPGVAAVPGADSQGGRWPRVSLLVPARDEELNIGRCLTSLLAQDYPDFEVIVLDDESTDQTAQIARGLTAAHPHLTVLPGAPLDSGWIGKHWACHQLAEASSGELLLFVDADTVHDPRMLRDAVAAQRAEAADLLTAFPRQIMVSRAERLVIPVIGWALLSLLPVRWAHRSQRPFLAGAIGQFMLFRRAAYERLGGHAAVRNDAVDDMALARRTKALGMRWRLVDGGRRVRCRMYRDRREVVDGFTKSIFPALGCRFSVMAGLFLVLGVAYLEPVGTLCLWALGGHFSAATLESAALATAVAWVTWLIAYLRFGYPWTRSLLYPATVAAVIALGVRSAVLTRFGETKWKGRVIENSRA